MLCAIIEDFDLKVHTNSIHLFNEESAFTDGIFRM